ncbi:hypothetical protein CHS0354_034917 [Potamilus streckersoni]|uniref:Serine protease n=1 Tax=Potamilus streckersoni TaxID=2493646 RepID=A0AAE0VTU8_9BIVA|nr:hypothetical protein CHS0354_034917 [Potamilus streckersoni]
MSSNFNQLNNNSFRYLEYILFSVPLRIPSRNCHKRIVVSDIIEHQLVASGSAAGNMRSYIDHTEAVYTHKQLAVLAESVGIIISPTVCGTGFRVGINYVMTAKHIVDQIMKETPVVLTQGTQPSGYLRLRNTDVYIDFAHERNGQQGDGNHRFNFEPDIIYANDSLDTVILKLKPDAKMYPPPFTNFSPLSEQTHQGYFIGHPRADIKRTDRFKSVTLTRQDIHAAKIWSQHQAGVDGFVGIDDPGRVLLHCSFGKGASGAPGFWICPNDGQAYVVMMLVRGYPDWYYDDKHPAAMKVGVPSNHLVEQDVPMESMHKDMKDKAYHLWQEIFCFV